MSKPSPDSTWAILAVQATRAPEDLVDEAGDVDAERDFGPSMCGPDGRFIG